jgi:hypothetical protein
VYRHGGGEDCVGAQAPMLLLRLLMPDVERLSLKDAASQLLDECRMVLPGIQALFGVQMIAVFNNRFRDGLTTGQQQLHLLATALVVVAIVLVMSPAAWHRRVDPRSVSDEFIRLSTRLLLASMVPLAMSISLDLYVVAQLVTASTIVSAAIATAAFVTFVTLWFLLPSSSARRA